MSGAPSPSKSPTVRPLGPSTVASGDGSTTNPSPVVLRLRIVIVPGVRLFVTARSGGGARGAARAGGGGGGGGGGRGGAGGAARAPPPRGPVTGEPASWAKPPA